MADSLCSVWERHPQLGPGLQAKLRAAVALFGCQLHQASLAGHLQDEADSGSRSEHTYCGCRLSAYDTKSRIDPRLSWSLYAASSCMQCHGDSRQAPSVVQALAAQAVPSQRRWEQTMMQTDVRLAALLDNQSDLRGSLQLLARAQCTKAAAPRNIKLLAGSALGTGVQDLRHTAAGQLTSQQLCGKQWTLGPQVPKQGTLLFPTSASLARATQLTKEPGLGSLLLLHNAGKGAKRSATASIGLRHHTAAAGLGMGEGFYQSRSPPKLDMPAALLQHSSPQQFVLWQCH